MPIYDFDQPQRFVVGTVGPSGERTFFLQARDGRRLVSVSCEKEQISTVADKLIELLDDMGVRDETLVAAYSDHQPLETPIEDEFRVTTVSLAWDAERRVIIIEAYHDHAAQRTAQAGSDTPGTETGAEEGPDQPDHLVRVTLVPEQARAFASRAKAVVSAGRPPCPFCGGPLDRTGHVCPRANGYRR